jgi:hypothetical protein
MPHYDSVDPAEEWQKGIFGFMTRYRGIASTAITSGAGTAASLFGGFYPLSAVIVAVGLSAVATLVWTRYYILRRIKSEDRLHAFHHEVRDALAKIVQCDDRPQTLVLVDAFNNKAAQGIAEFFRIRCGDQSINCAIRLAESDTTGHDRYVTRARSSGMHPGRDASTVSIRSDEGIARAMLGRQKRGVYIVPSIEEAISQNIWKSNDNDKLADVQSLMISPINGWQGGAKYMLGILYVTSAIKNGGKFSSVDSLPVKAFADALGLAYPVIWDKITQVASIPPTG